MSGRAPITCNVLERRSTAPDHIHVPQRIINLIAFLDALPLWLRIPVGIGLGVAIILILRFITSNKASANNRGSLMGPAAITCGAVVAICQLINLSINWGDL